MESIKEYINKDLFKLSYEEFCDKLNYGVDLSKIELDGQIEYTILLLNLKESPIRYSEANNSDFPLKRFDGAVLLSKRLDGSEWKMLNMNHEDYIGEINLKLFENQCDIKTLNFTDNMIQLMRFRTMQLIDKRGICMPNDRAIQFYCAFATKDDKWYTHYQNYKVVSAWEKCSGEILKRAKEKGIFEDGLYKTEKGIFSGMQIVKMMAKKYDVLVPIINKRGYEIRPSDVTEYMKTNTYKEESDVYRANLSLNLTFHYEWFVYLRETDKSVGFKIPILPQNYHEIFSLRDIPEGAQRRKALVHFVREHSRIIKRENVDTKTLVHKYLRGETKFNWRGLQVDVIPSKSDIINTRSNKKFCDK